MKLLLLNSVCGTGSTGRICVDIAREYEQNGYDVKIAYGRNESSVPADARKYAVRIGTDLDVYAHVLYTRLTDKHGLASKSATRKFLKWADEYDPDILWIHNIHGYYINYELLFAWIKGRPQMQVKWTLHDCWAFTGHCAFYLYANCDRWQTTTASAYPTSVPSHPTAVSNPEPCNGNCTNCPQTSSYPASRCKKNTSLNYARKKQAFTGLSNLTLITPSKWLADELSHSFLSEYPVEVVYNRIDTDIFKPTPSDFRITHGIPDDDVLILGVANKWEKRKGLDDLLALDNLLRTQSETSEDHRKHRIVLVGLDSKQIQSISASNPDIIALGRTESAAELAQIYTAADVFVNPTREDNLPTVNLESEACGTPVITYDTGGCAETIHLPESRVIGHSVDDIIQALEDMHYA